MINKTILVGRLTRDPELRKTDNGKTVSSFTLACNKRYGGEEQADFINCVAWEKSAEFLCNYLQKGALIGIEGRIQSRSYEDSTGKRIYVQEVVVEHLQSLEPKQKQSNSNGYVEDLEPEFSIKSDDLPF